MIGGAGRLLLGARAGRPTHAAGGHNKAQAGAEDCDDIVVNKGLDRLLKLSIIHA